MGTNQDNWQAAEIANNTLTFPFGETPAVVIRQQHDYWANTDGVQEHHWALDTPIDELLTVLDSLHRSDFQFSWGDGAAADKARRDRSRQLRISILSALAIDES